MLAAIVHRGPDDEGVLIAPTAVAGTRHVKRGLHLPSVNLIVEWILPPRPPAVGRENIAPVGYDAIGEVDGMPMYETKSPPQGSERVNLT